MPAGGTDGDFGLDFEFGLRFMLIPFELMARAPGP
jgi:hypothetical protein